MRRPRLRHQGSNRRQMHPNDEMDELRRASGRQEEIGRSAESWGGWRRWNIVAVSFDQAPAVTRLALPDQGIRIALQKRRLSTHGWKVAVDGEVEFSEKQRVFRS